MPEWVIGTVAFLEPWWPLVAKVGLLWFLQQGFKKRLWTKARANTNKFFRMMRSSMWLHPVLGGIAWGFAFPFLPASKIVETQGGAINEGIIAGLITVIGYRAIEATAEYFVKKDPESKWQIVLRVLHETVRARETVMPSPVPKKPPSN